MNAMSIERPRSAGPDTLPITLDVTSTSCSSKTVRAWRLGAVKGPPPPRVRPCRLGEPRRDPPASKVAIPAEGISVFNHGRSLTLIFSSAAARLA